MNKTTLYSITTDYNSLMQSIEDAEGEITEEQQEQLTINENQLQSKSIAYLEFIQTKESFNTRIDEEIKRLQAMKKANGNLVSRLKDNLLNAVNQFGDFEVGLTKFGTRKSTQVIVTANPNDLDSEFKTTKITETANKAAIKAAIKEGINIEGCELKEINNLKIN